METDVSNEDMIALEIPSYPRIHETVRESASRLHKFISSNKHEGLGMEEHTELIAHCVVLLGCANTIEDLEMKLKAYFNKES